MFPFSVGFKKGCFSKKCSVAIILFTDGSSLHLFFSILDIPLLIRKCIHFQIA